MFVKFTTSDFYLFTFLSINFASVFSDREYDNKALNLEIEFRMLMSLCLKVVAEFSCQELFKSEAVASSFTPFFVSVQAFSPYDIDITSVGQR